MDSAVFQATFTDWRLIKGRKVVQIVMEVPIELADQAYQVLGGMPDPGKSVWCAVARLAGEGVTEERGTDSHAVSRSPRKPSTEKRLAAQAGMLCATPLFQKFIDESFGFPGRKSDDESFAASIVRLQCQVASRSEIIPGSPAALRWDELYSCFVAWRDAPELVA